MSRRSSLLDNESVSSRLLRALSKQSHSLFSPPDTHNIFCPPPQTMQPPLKHLKQGASGNTVERSRGGSSGREGGGTWDKSCSHESVHHAEHHHLTRRDPKTLKAPDAARDGGKEGGELC